MVRTPALTALLAALAFAGPIDAQAAGGAAPTVMSLDSCADQFVLALSPREAIVGLSARADDRDSYMRDAARGLPVRRATTEAVLAARPDVVVRYWGGDARLEETLRRRGVRVVRINDATDFEAVRANVRDVAAALDRRAAGEAMVAGMDARLAGARGAWNGAPALYLTPSGFTTGPGSLVDAMLRAAGMTNLAVGSTWKPIPLEQLVMRPPRAFVLGFFDAFAVAMDRWGPGRHRALKTRLPGRTVAALPSTILGCPAWFAAEGPEILARAKRP
ncbi:MAG: ABC transporter substrate-binding protein [Caulobacter sp.]|nr:ABC transporter substrate-binding protein [Caulobacter sp.]